MFRANYSTSTIRLRGQASGSAKITLYSENADYISHILTIRVFPVAPRLKQLTTIPGKKIISTGSYERGKYSYKVSAPGMVKLYGQSLP